MQNNKSEMVHLVEFHALIVRSLNDPATPRPIPEFWSPIGSPIGFLGRPAPPSTQGYQARFDFVDHDEFMPHRRTGTGTR